MYRFLALILWSILFLPTLAYSSPNTNPRDQLMESTLNAVEAKQKGYYKRSSEEMEKYYWAKKELDTEPIGSMAEEEKFFEQEGKGSFYISAGHDANHMHYKEYSGSDTLDEDYGKLRGFYVSLGYKSGHRLAWLMETKPFIEGYFRRYDELITYDGASSLGNPLAFEEKAEIHRFGLKLGGYHSFSSKKEGLFYIDIGNRTWYRGENGVIQGVLTYAERYRWTYLGVGLGFNYKLFPKLTCGIEIEGMGALDSKMRADFLEGGTFVLKGVGGWEFKLPIKYYLLKNISLDVTPYSTWWNITESSPVSISGTYYYEPNSHTHIEGLLVGITCRL